MTPLHVVLGAGPAGSTLAAELAHQGLAVRQVARSPFTPGDPRVEARLADVSTPAGAIAATRGASVIHHAVNVAYPLQVDLLPGITEAIIAAAATHDARLVVLDTLYPYGEADGDAITEATPWAATSRKGRMRAALDRRYLAAHHDGEARVVLGRAADFFGPGVFTSSLGGTFFPPALAGAPVLALGRPELPHSYTFIRDVARRLARLGTDPRGDGRVWHLPTVPAVATLEVHRIVGELLGAPLDVDVVEHPRPHGPFDAAFMAEYAELFYQHVTPQNMVSTAFETTFGLRPTPLPDALAETLAWFRATAGDANGAPAAPGAA